ncbi:hypothetical protein L6164_037500 [Bauhinia variegata]|uniref:Uncharacterized protein n=1 Tax=Bauhinia variegata TaxID=167791 RepID=A0ACB9KKD9_BAUVA|nr:hypothetical protein L6164_037500 [Bauhinia variegata]
MSTTGGVDLSPPHPSSSSGSAIVAAVISVLILGVIIVFSVWFARRAKHGVKDFLSSINVNAVQFQDVQRPTVLEFAESSSDSTSGGSNSYWYKESTPIMKKYEIQVASS